jgi:hypothetical protein
MWKKRVKKHSQRGLFVTEEICDEAIEVSISYAGPVGTSLWVEIKEDRDLVGLAHFFFAEIC